MATGKRMAAAVCGLVWMLLLGWGLALIGCDTIPSVPTTADGKVVETVAVDPNDPDEQAGVGDLLAAAVRYEYALKVVQGYFERTGAYDEQLMAERELANLRRAQPWKFGGVEPPSPPEGQPVEGASEAALVEQVVMARRAWRECLDKLADLYQRKGLTFKLKLVRNVRQRLDPVRTYDYFMHAEVPPANLRPSEVVPAADALFERALRLYHEGKPLPAMADYRKERQALLLFRQLVDEHPTSTKIAQAAYYIGEIYKEYFDEDIRAVQWYERAWQWDPNITLPARFQAAVVYDIRLGQYGKALELYHEVIKHEQFNQSNVDFSARRIGQLKPTTEAK